MTAATEPVGVSQVFPRQKLKIAILLVVVAVASQNDLKIQHGIFFLTWKLVALNPCNILSKNA